MFSRNFKRMGCTPRIDFQGRGYLAGEAPLTPDPDEPDGRFKILNVPSRGRVSVYERVSMTCVRSTLSAADGTWRVEYINPDMRYVVIGFEDRGLQNAAVQDWIAPAAMV